MDSRAKRCATGDFGIEKPAATVLSRDIPNISVLAERSDIACPLEKTKGAVVTGARRTNCDQSDCNPKTWRISNTSVGLYAVKPIRSQNVLAVRAVGGRSSRPFS